MKQNQFNTVLIPINIRNMNKFAFTLTLLFSTILITSCKHKACTKPDAINYDSNAEKDDGSCQFQSQVVFWYGQNISDSLIAAGTNSLTYYVNDVSLGSASTTKYWDVEPECELSTTLKFDVEMNNNEKSLYIYEVLNQSGNVVWSGTVNFYANECHKIPLYN